MFMHPKKYQKHDRAEQPALYVWKSDKMRIYKIREAQVLLFLVGWLVGWRGGVVCFFLKIMTKKGDDDSTFSRSWFVLSQRINSGSALGVESIAQQQAEEDREKAWVTENWCCAIFPIFSLSSLQKED